MKKMILFCGILAALLSRGDAIEKFAGAWARAEDPDVAVLVVSADQTVWSLEGGRWAPTFRVSEREDCVSYRRLAGGDIWCELGKPAEWKVRAVSRQGVSVRKGDILWSERFGNGENLGEWHVMVCAKAPNWSKALDVAPYVGNWKPVKVRSCDSAQVEESGPEVENEGILKIRDDLNMVFWRRDHKPTGNRPEPFDVWPLVPTEGWLRVDYREEYARHRDPFNSVVDGLWIDGNGHLMRCKDSKVVEFVRTEETFADPVDARAEMARSGKYQGVWGRNSEFNIFMLAFDASGKGIFSGFMVSLPFDWTVAGGGKISCRFNPEIRKMYEGERMSFPDTLICRYDERRNAMIVLDFKTKGEMALPFRQSEVSILKTIAALEARCDSKEFRTEMRQRELRKKKEWFDRKLAKMKNDPSDILDVDIVYPTEEEMNRYLNKASAFSDEMICCYYALTDGEAAFTEEILVKLLDKLDWAKADFIACAALGRKEQSAETLRKFAPRVEALIGKADERMIGLYYGNPNTPRDVLESARARGGFSDELKRVIDRRLADGK